MNTTHSALLLSRQSTARIAAWSGAFVVHGLALGFLLLPITSPQVPARIERALEALWIALEPPVEVQPLPPVPDPPRLPARRDIVRVAATPVVVAATPVPVAAAQAAQVPVEPVAPSAPETASGNGAGVDRGQLAYLDAPPPRYPAEALRKHQQGTVLLEVLVDEQGRPRAVTLVRSSGHPLLDAEARRHVLKHWRFRPALRDGVAIPARGLVPLRFAITAG